MTRTSSVLLASFGTHLISRSLSYLDVVPNVPSVRNSFHSYGVQFRFLLYKHPLLINPGKTSDKISTQIINLVKRLKKQNSELHSVTVTRVVYTGDIWDYIQV
jgi:hypothetical protein